MRRRRAYGPLGLIAVGTALLLWSRLGPSHGPSPVPPPVPVPWTPGVLAFVALQYEAREAKHGLWGMK
jgi:lipopolysaccharide export LptBFGC system permease protein LptF